jgi:molybdopterin-guanine dinucleotide biosynthesis protein B
VKLVAFVGWSGSGKTTLLVRLLPLLRRRGLRVAALKHSHHSAFDAPGSDSARLRRAGAEAVAVQGPQGLAYFGPQVLSARALARRLPPVDLVLCEGFKTEPIPKIEVRRRGSRGPSLCAADRRVMALVGPGTAPEGLPRFSARALRPLADFLADFARR